MTLTALDKDLLKTIADMHDIPQGAYNIRRNGEAVTRKSSANIEIIPKTDKPGIDIIVKPGTVNESVHIPVIITKSGVEDLVYNTFDIGAGSDVVVVAGCGIHNNGDDKTQHNGIHEIIVRSGAKIKYVEKHYGQGEGKGQKVLNPQTIIRLEEGAIAELELVQIRGVDDSIRDTKAYLEKNASLIMVEKLLTHQDQHAESKISVELNGSDANAQIIARSVAQDRSYQVFRASMAGNSNSRGHVECDSIIMDDGKIIAVPELHAMHSEAELTHEAAIGRIAGEQLYKLMTLGLTEKEAVETILSGFLR